VVGFYAPGSSFTFAQAINSAGIVTGYYAVSGRILGFLRSASGTITSFAAPGANSTQAYNINTVGAVAGSCVDAAGHHGFVRNP
jgi:hypothetical protein